MDNVSFFSYYDDFLTERSFTLPSNESQVLYFPQEDLRLAHLRLFLPLSTLKASFTHAFTMLHAVQKWNQQIGETCNLRFSVDDIFDTKFDPITATIQWNQINSTIPTTAVIGSYRSAVTAPLAILTGVQNTVQISHAATSNDLDAKDQYPLFGRTVPSNQGEAAVALQYFRQVAKSSHIAIVYIADSFGTALEKSFSEQAIELGIRTISFALPFEASDEQVERTMRQLQASGIQHYYAICFEVQLLQWTRYAKRVGLDKNLWVFPGLDIDSFNDAESELNHALLEGSLLVNMVGNVPSSPINLSDPTRTISDTSGEENYRTFLQNWNQVRSNQKFLDFLAQKLPTGKIGSVGETPSSLCPFMDDAIMSLGLAICSSQNQFPSGEEIFAAFKSTDLEGASGQVKILSDTGSRDYNTVDFVIWNVQWHENKQTLVPSMSIKQGTWTTNGNNTLIYPGITLKPPPPLEEQNVDHHYIGRSARITSYSLLGLVFITVVTAISWIYLYRDERPVRVSGVMFLSLLCLGSLVMSSIIIPLSFDEEITTSLAGLDTACMLSPWLFIIGLSVTMTGLTAKTIACYRAYLNPELNVLPLTLSTYAKTAAVILFFNATILGVWSGLSPFEWIRVETNRTDRFGRAIESFGACRSNDSALFISLLLVFNGLLLISTNLMNLKARNIGTEGNESSHVATSLALMLQIVCIAIPIVVVVEDDPIARFVVLSVLVFLLSVSPLLFVLIPKILLVVALEKNRREYSKSTVSRHSSQVSSQKSKKSDDVAQRDASKM